MKTRLGPIAFRLALALLLFFSFCVDFSNTSQGGAIDLRNRITGVRLLVHHIDPYFYKWREPQPPEYCDVYNNLAVPVSKTTVTPTFLLLFQPLALLPYRLGQFLWFFAQWLLLLGTAFLWRSQLAPGWPRALLALFLVGLTYTAAWRLHAERGQSYVLLLFVFGAWLVCTLQARWGNHLLTGLLAGFLVALRPSFLLIAPFLFLHRRGQLAGAALGLVVAVALPMLWQTDCWTRYASAMQTHSLLYRTDTDPEPPPQRFPPRIEGARTAILANYVTIPYADFSIHRLLGSMRLEPCPDWIPLIAILLPFAGWMVWSRGQSLERLLLGLAVWIFLVDLFLPAYRNSYNDVLILNIVALGLLAFARVPWGVWACFLAVLIGWLIDLTAPMHDWLIDLPSFLFTLGAVLLLFVFDSPRQVRKV